MLHSDEHEDVSMEWWDPAASFELNASGGMEILVIKGSFFEGDEQFQYQSWLRLPVGSSTRVEAGPEGCAVWIKKNHLRIPPKPPTTA